MGSTIEIRRKVFIVELVDMWITGMLSTYPQVVLSNLTAYKISLQSRWRAPHLGRRMDLGGGVALGVRRTFG